MSHTSRKTPTVCTVDVEVPIDPDRPNEVARLEKGMQTALLKLIGERQTLGSFRGVVHIHLEVRPNS